MDNDWFRIESNKTGTRWKGKCWYYHENVKYEFDLQFEIPVTYPTTPIELELPELDGKTAKMYRGGKICLTIHFKPLWAKNVPHFGIAHALALGLAPWMAAEIPHLVTAGVLRDRVPGASDGPVESPLASETMDDAANVEDIPADAIEISGGSDSAAEAEQKSE
eukprot:TRINITY_DN3966_c0_g1_i3.p1 TRINITY_DN3966_c0_g1~~TRINITY_DN3966_c0_g1_i3.p1  ORF type:complete len:180 (+),score=77.00 TRINITY_DN3966_c0_g1_i3:50-541(+)